MDGLGTQKKKRILCKKKKQKTKNKKPIQDTLEKCGQNMVIQVVILRHVSAV